jgi:hypothetical protein
MTEEEEEEEDEEDDDEGGEEEGNPEADDDKRCRQPPICLANCSVKSMPSSSLISVWAWVEAAESKPLRIASWTERLEEERGGMVGSGE